MATGIQTGIRRGSRSGLARNPQSEKATPIQKARQTWSSLSASTRTGIVASVLLLSLLGVGLGAHGVSHRYIDLYQTKLSKQDLPAISRALDEMGIDHQVNETQDGVMVHPDHKIKAQAGL